MSQKALFALAFLMPSVVGPIDLEAQTFENRVYDDGQGNTIDYRVYLPQGHDQPGREFPVVLWLNNTGLPELIAKLGSGPNAAFLVKPEGREWGTRSDCNGGQNGSTHVWCPPGLTPRMELSLGALEEVESEFSIDASRRVLGGYSDGGVATFETLLERPGFFSAAVPLQSGYEARRFRQPSGTRVWAMHGRNDSFLLPFHSSGTIAALTREGNSPIYLEPRGDHDAAYISRFLTDVDNELFPWMFDAIEPPLARIIYDPENGNLQVDATTAPGGSISRMELAGQITPPAIDAIAGDPIQFSRRRLTYEATGEMGFTGVVDLGRMLPVGMDLTQVHNSLSALEYDSPGAVTKQRTFRVAMAPSNERPQTLDTVLEEPWAVYSIHEGLAPAVDLGLQTEVEVGGSRDRRVVAKFQLPELPTDTQHLERATLRIYINDVSADSTSVSLWHAATDNDYEPLPTDFSDEVFVDTQLTLFSSADETQSYYELDVTNLVSSDYQDDDGIVVSSFRLQSNGDVNDWFRLAMPRDRIHYPQLILSYGSASDVLGDFNGDGNLDVHDIDELTRQSANRFDSSHYDLNGDGLVDVADIRQWISSAHIFNSRIGDADLDGEFDSADLVEVFKAGEYEDSVPMNSAWSTGDWNGDGEFDSGDLVYAFQDGGYELGPRLSVAPVPEPTGSCLSIMFFVSWCFLRKRSNAGSMRR